MPTVILFTGQSHESLYKFSTDSFPKIIKTVCDSQTIKSEHYFVTFTVAIKTEENENYEIKKYMKATQQINKLLFRSSD